jgi:hypothetical protein
MHDSTTGDKRHITTNRTLRHGRYPPSPALHFSQEVWEHPSLAARPSALTLAQRRLYAAAIFARDFADNFTVFACHFRPFLGLRLTRPVSR